MLAEASAQLANALIDGRPPSNDGSNHANDKRYHSLRDEARKAQSQHAHYAAEASKAYKRGDKEEASQLSQESKRYESHANELNEEAAVYVLNANNTDSKSDEIDLHGLFVSEALTALESRINVSQQRHQPVIKAIVGKGLHSEDHIAKLRPAVLKHCKERGMPADVETHNPGVVVIHIARAGAPSQVSEPHGAAYTPHPPHQGYQQGYQQGHAYGHSQGQGAYGHGLSQQDIRQGFNLIRKLFSLFRQCLA